LFPEKDFDKVTSELYEQFKPELGSFSKYLQDTENQSEMAKNFLTERYRYGKTYEIDFKLKRSCQDPLKIHHTFNVPDILVKKKKKIDFGKVMEILQKELDKLRDNKTTKTKTKTATKIEDKEKKRVATLRNRE